jgi:endogenous inhibitor of DNA gyrase (YacG/DUF329 family)
MELIQNYFIQKGKIYKPLLPIKVNMARPKGIPSKFKGMKLVEREKVICKNCGKEIECYKSMHRKFCSKECGNKFRIGEKRPEQSLFLKKKHKIMKFGYKKGENMGNKNPMKRPEVIKKHRESVIKRFGIESLKEKRNCKICKKEFFVQNREIKKGYGNYCSKKCHGISLRTGELGKCKNCNKSIWIQPNVNQKFCSMKCSQDFQKKSFLGKNNSAWIDGRSYDKHYLPEFRVIRREISQRDNFKCMLCQIEESKLKQHSIHHIDYNKNNNQPSNLITLCVSCHSKTGINRKYWTNYFKQIMRILYGE